MLAILAHRTGSPTAGSRPGHTPDVVAARSPVPRAVFFEEAHAREVVVRLRREGYDGWLDVPDQEPSAVPPLDLPSAPKRVRRQS
ncbi:MAG: hypothetical protein ABI873_13095 [Marmoricola sp.]